MKTRHQWESIVEKPQQETATMSRKNKAARAFFHQNPDASPKDAWDAAWANNQATFHAGSMQEADSRIADLEAKLAAAEADAGRMRGALEALISVAERCDGWESFPSDALDAAIDAARSAK